MIETIVFMILPVLIALFAWQSRFFHNWCFLLNSSLAVYISFWTYPLISGLIKEFYPKELQFWSVLITLAGTMFFCLVIFYKITHSMASHGGGGYHLPKSRTLLTLIPCALTGLLYSGVIGYLICVSPLYWKFVKTESFSQKAVRRMQIFTGIMDRLSLQDFSFSQRKQVLEKRVFPPEDPAVVAARKAEKLRAEKAAAEKIAAEEKAAAEKAAAEKARKAAAAARKKRRSGKIGTKFIPEQYGNSIRDAHPVPSPATPGTKNNRQKTKK
jgi:hypothetical protein